MSLKLKALTKSIWVYHLCVGGSCNNCDIEILDLLTPRYDVERFGIVLVGSVRHADAILVTGSLSLKAIDRVKRIYEQAPKPCVVIAIGACACGQGIFKNGPATPNPVDTLLPINIYIPGCPPKPEAMILGIVKLIKKLQGKK
ncbi:MAG: NADH-quinone oxidoreductase subunit NuoB [Candidatus Omnitrophica bacterium]|nr:NADH-quinone oxidoreductase subunit NuoB [Candidatus Omnitrophota bacterium]MBU4589916.1 NADH-quinone oxidoreductase subunit NuoB [Candidatus Omnitrophota bacterium]